MNERSQKCRAKVLDDEGRVVPGEIVGHLQGDVVKNEGADDAVDGANDELVKILRPKALGNSQEPFHVLAVGRIPGVLGLRSIVVHPSSQRFQREHTHSIRRNEGS